MTEVTLAILAGGKGSRMGAPKSALIIGGKPILEYLLNRFAWPGPTLLITGHGNQHPPGYERFNLEATDALPNQGPLRGILTALEHATTDLVALITVDMPNVTTEMISDLINHLDRNHSTLGAMYQRNIGGKAEIEPFPCVLRRELHSAITLRLKDDKRSVHGLIEEKVHAIAWPEQDQNVWRNLNAPEDLSA